MSFNPRKAAQVIAFLTRERGGKIDFITVVKLAYLSDRRFVEKYDLPILNDELVSMEHGPVDSATYNYLKGRGGDGQDIWNSYVRTNNKNEVALTRKLSADDFDELSRAETKVLRDTARDFEHFKNPFDLVNWVHKYCTEWEDVGRTSRPLSYHRIFEALGKKNSSALTDRLYEFKNLQEAHLRTK